MKGLSLLTTLFFVVFLSGCFSTTGEIRGKMFYLEHDFTAALVDDDWQVIQQEKGVRYGAPYVSSVYEISFNHKKSNGMIGVNSFILSEVGQARSLEIHAEDAIARWEGIKLSQRMIKVDGIEAIEVVMSGKYMAKYIFLKKGQNGYEIVYTNTPTYFDEYLSVFDKFVETFKTL